MNATIHEALAELERKPGAKIVALVTWTRPPMLKKHRKTGDDNPHACGVEKVTERFGTIGATYESVVNRQRGREGQPLDAGGVERVFKAESLWHGKGEHVPDSRFLVRHRDTGRLYLSFLPRGNGLDRWRDVATGRNLDPQDLAPYLPRPAKSKRQETDKEIGWRTIAVENVLEIRCGETYRITGG